MYLHWSQIPAALLGGAIAVIAALLICHQPTTRLVCGIAFGLIGAVVGYFSILVLIWLAFKYAFPNGRM